MMMMLILIITTINKTTKAKIKMMVFEFPIDNHIR